MSRWPSWLSSKSYWNSVEISRRKKSQLLWLLLNTVAENRVRHQSYFHAILIRTFPTGPISASFHSTLGNLSLWNYIIFNDGGQLNGLVELVLHDSGCQTITKDELKTILKIISGALEPGGHWRLVPPLAFFRGWHPYSGVPLGFWRSEQDDF